MHRVHLYCSASFLFSAVTFFILVNILCSKRLVNTAETCWKTPRANCLSRAICVDRSTSLLFSYLSFSRIVILSFRCQFLLNGTQISRVTVPVKEDSGKKLQPRIQCQWGILGSQYVFRLESKHKAFHDHERTVLYHIWLVLETNLVSQNSLSTEEPESFLTEFRIE